MYVVISYGNALRSDDGAGFVLGKIIAKYLSKKGHRVHQIETHQLTPELIYDLPQANDLKVVFVDTCQATAVDRIVVQNLMFDQVAPSMGHQMTPGLLLYLVNQLLNRHCTGWLVAIPGWDFGFGFELSLQTQKCLLDFSQNMDIILQPLFQNQDSGGHTYVHRD